HLASATQLVRHRVVYIELERDTRHPIIVEHCRLLHLEPTDRGDLIYVVGAPVVREGKRVELRRVQAGMPPHIETGEEPAERYRAMPAHTKVDHRSRRRMRSHALQVAPETDT